MRVSRTAIVCTQPATTSRQVQSSTLNGPSWIGLSDHSSPRVIQAQTCKHDHPPGLGHQSAELPPHAQGLAERPT